tara:strand:+ start:206 stop:1093 length:888 start_codon:yes stop_codon:yes gene_type:complete
MAQVTGGKVTYTRRVQAAQFEPKEATVELAFAFSDGEKNFEDFLDQVANSAITKVHTMIGIPAPRPAQSGSSALSDKVTEGALSPDTSKAAPAEEIHGIGATSLDLTGRIDMGATMATPEPEANATEGRTKADLAAEKIAEVSDPAAIEATPARKKPGRPPKVQNQDPAALSTPSEETAGTSDPAALGPSEASGSDTKIPGASPGQGGAAANDAGTPSGAAPSDPAAIGVEDWEAVAPAPTDAEMQAKIASTNTRIQNPTAIKQLIYKFAGDPPKTFRDIPAEVRLQFVKELEAL